MMHRNLTISAIFGAFFLLSNVFASSTTRILQEIDVGGPRPEECVASLPDVVVEFVGEDAFDPNSIYNAFGVSQLTFNAIQVSILINGFLFFSGDQFFGRNGEFTDEVLMQHDLALEFWGVDAEDVRLIAGHSEILANPETLEFALMAVFLVNGGNGFAEAQAFAAQNVDTVKDYIENQFPGNYSNPALTLNAFAKPLSIESFDGALIVLGDGALEKFDLFDLGAVANDLIHAHEFAHTLQFSLSDVRPILIPEGPELTRRNELEADAMAAYFLAHEQGRNFNATELGKAVWAGFRIGDCGFTNVGHHGTPDQRACATLWGANEGLTDGGAAPMTPLQFRDLFEENLELILDTDESVCGDLLAFNGTDSSDSENGNGTDSSASENGNEANSAGSRASAGIIMALVAMLPLSFNQFFL